MASLRDIVSEYYDGRAVQLTLMKMSIDLIEHFFGFSYDFRPLQHDRTLLKDIFYFYDSRLTHHGWESKAFSYFLQIMYTL